VIFCGRPGCDEPATATFTFNSRQQTVWLDHLDESPASAGHLCRHHADRVTPPRGWELQDRRDLARVIDHPGESETVVDEDRTPMLARAFRAARRAS
jgi:Protein of unknown function (DUF3499)